MYFAHSYCSILEENFVFPHKLTYVALFILSNIYVFTGRLNFQKVSEDLFVNLHVRHSDGEVNEVILVQQFEDLSHGFGNDALFVIPKSSCGQKTNSRLMNNSMWQNAKTQDLRLQVERWQMNRGRCCWQHKRANSWKHFNKTQTKPLLALWIMYGLDEAQLIICCKELNSGMLLICLLNTSAVTILNTPPMKEKHCTSIYWWILKHCNAVY